MDPTSGTPPQSSSLREAYGRAAAIIGSEAESFQIAEEVERLRSAWRPPHVCVVILAESHVWTDRDEAESRVQQPDGVETGFVRFIYCLGYGERCLAPRVSRNRKTWQYWTLLYDAVHEPASVGEVWPREAEERILAKLRLLSELKDAGVWLVDASVTALYKPRHGRLVTGSKYKKLLRCCWEAHVRNVIASCHTSAVLIVGKGVDDAIGNLVRLAVPRAEVKVISQPNARMTREVRCNERRKVYDFCRRHRCSSA